MNWKDLLKKAWLPLTVVIIIGAGVALFSGAAKSARDAENARQVMLEKKTGSVTAAATDGSRNVDPQAAPVNAKYRVVDILDEHSPPPTEGALNCNEAAAVAVGYAETIFDTVIKDCTVFSHYYQYEGMSEAVYLISIDGEDVETCKYRCVIDPFSGALHSARVMPVPSTGASSGTADTELMEKARHDPAVREVAYSLIKNHFLDGRIIEEIMVDGVQWTFGAYGQPGFDVQLDCKVRMSSGACYAVSVAYPSMAILSVDVYPLGWESCLWGYRTAEEMTAPTPVPAAESGEPSITRAPDPDTGWSMAEGVEQGRETPRPTPTPTPKSK